MALPSQPNSTAKPKIAKLSIQPGPDKRNTAP
jgi:hypothetical protein